MPLTPLTLDSSLRQAYRTPLGRDVFDKLFMQVGVSPKLIMNPFLGSLRIGALKYLTFGKFDDDFLESLVTLFNQTLDQPLSNAVEPTPAWWKEAVFYQIYPRSFQDSNGDGIGDLQGIISRLDYLEQLGIGALWLSPVYDSPNDDNGYDIRDYREVMDEFGTMEDLELLIEGAHARGMKVIMDLVVNHTSDEHPWFQEALANPQSPYRDYYFIEPGTPDRPPNNWTSFFSGPAWRYYPEQRVWALHLFSSKQMDLNWENPAVRQEVVDIINWWGERGIDGFRLDVINYISKVPGLPDGNQLVGEIMSFTGVEHYFHGPRLHEFLHQIRKEGFDPNDMFAVGETPGIGAQAGKLMVGDYRGELDVIFNFDHLETPGHERFDDYRYDLNYLKKYYTEYQRDYGGHYWMSLFFENHDNPRMISKVDPRPEHRDALGKLLGTILLTLRGTPFIYQGQELGMVNQDFESLGQLRDVEALNKYAALIAEGSSQDEAFAVLMAGTRDHARVPVRWDATEHGGFTTGTPWIEGTGDGTWWTAEDQIQNPDSVLSHYRALIQLRNENSELVYSEVEFLDEERRNLWVYTRGTFLVVMNLGDAPLAYDGIPHSATLILSSGLVEADELGGTALLGPYESRIYRLSPQN